MNKKRTDETNLPKVVHDGLVEENIVGHGKGGGHGHTPVESPDTLKTTEYCLTLCALGEGPIDQFITIYFDDTRAEYIPGVGYHGRYGNSGQSKIPNFGKTFNVIPVGVELTHAVKHQIDTSTELVDHVDVIIEIPAMYKVLKTRDRAGDMVGHSVTLRFETRVQGGTYVTVFDKTISGKCTTPYKKGFRVDRPDNYNGFVWTVRVSRVSQDDADTSFQSKTTWSSAMEVQDHARNYPNTALVGTIVSAKATGGNIPRMTFEVKGLKVKVPTTYDAPNHQFVGNFDGGFKAALEWTNNPAWILLDLITNTRYGLGIPMSQVDTYSFANAAAYCDQVANYTDEDGVLTPGYRFTFNGVLQTYENAYQLIQSVASCMRGFVIDLGGLLTVIQDRPVAMDPVSGIPGVGQPLADQIFTNSNVIDGVFEYNSNTLAERYTEVNVTWNDQKDRYLQKVTTVPHPNDTTYTQFASKYQRNVVDIAAVGCTNEGQAYRLGKYYLDNSLCTPENVQFRTSIENAFVIPGEVILVDDDHYIGTTYGGRVAPGTTAGNIKFDRAITIGPGIGYISIYATDDNVYTRQINQSNGTFTEVTVTSGFPFTPEVNLPYVLNSPNRAPRPFRISKITLLSGDQQGQMEISGMFYDVNKYNRVDGLPVIAIREFTDPTLYSSAAPINITSQLRTVVDSVNNVSWTNIEFIWSPGDGASYTYKLKYSREALPFTEVGNIPTNTYTLEHADGGWYDVRLYAVNSIGIISPEARYQVTYGSSDNPNAPPPAPNPIPRLFPPINIKVTGGLPDGRVFAAPDLNVEWTNPNTITGKDSPIMQDFVLEIYQNDGVTLLATYLLLPSTPYFSYTFSRNRADHGGVHADRNVTIKFYCRDTFLRRSDAAVAAFFNPPPPPPTTAIVAVGTDATTVQIIGELNRPSDIAGYIIARSTQNNFDATNPLTRVYNGTDYINDVVSLPGVNYYYRTAIYDTFGTDLILFSAQISSRTLSSTGLLWEFDGIDMKPNCNVYPSATVVPNAVAWSAGNAYVTEGDPTSPTGQKTTRFPISAGSALWTTGILFIYYVYNATTLSTTIDFGIAIASDRIVIGVYKGGTNLVNQKGKAFLDGQFLIAGTVGAAQVTAGSLITNEAQINAALINTTHIKFAAIDTLHLKYGAVTDIKFFGDYRDPANELAEQKRSFIQASDSNFQHIGTEVANPGETFLGQWNTIAPTNIPGPFLATFIGRFRIHSVPRVGWGEFQTYFELLLYEYNVVRPGIPYGPTNIQIGVQYINIPDGKTHDGVINFVAWTYVGNLYQLNYRMTSRAHTLSYAPTGLFQADTYFDALEVSVISALR